MSGEHSVIPPSSAGIWGKPKGCPGWVLMAQLNPEDEDGEAAREGEAAHEMCETMVGHYLHHNILEWSHFDGKCAKNGEPFTEEMYEGATEYMEDVGSMILESGMADQHDYWGLEDRIHCPSIHELSWGTSDAWLYNTYRSKLTIWDYKYGFESVDAEENYQCINYANGLMDRLGLLNGLIDQTITVEIRVIQPRAYHDGRIIKTWEVPGSDLRAYFNHLRNGAEAALRPGAQVNSGSHCKHCQSRHNCPAALQAAMGMYEATRDAVPLEMSNVALGVQLSQLQRAKDHINKMYEAYMERAEVISKQGSYVPGWVRTPSEGRRKWTQPNGVILAVGDMIGVDLRKQESPITPTQAISKIKKLDKKVDPEVITAYYERPKSIKLKPEKSDNAKKVFTNE